MPTFAQFDVSELNTLNDTVQNSAGSARTLESAAQGLVETVYRTFEESCVLTRVYATVPYQNLPDFNKGFVSNLAQAKGVSDALKENTPVLSLLGTYGREPNWRDRTKSQGHVGIPLVSSAFVGEIPMIARLLQQIGIGLQWIDAEDVRIVQDNASKLSGMFFVPDAASEVDSKGRKVIPMQDFVQQYGVKTVFGFGGGYANGTIVVLIVFANESVPEGKAKAFEPLISSFKGSTAPLVTAGQSFN